MSKSNVITNEISFITPINGKSSLVCKKPKSNSVTEDPANSKPFKGFLLAAYKSIGNNVRAIKMTRTMLIIYILILVIIPPVLIIAAFLLFPVQTARFFDFQIKTQ